MYRYINYGKLFEQTDPTAPQPAQPTQSADLKEVSLMLALNEADLSELRDLLTGNVNLALFTKPATFVNTTKPDINAPVTVPGLGSSTNLVLAIANSDESTALFPKTTDLDPSKNMIFKVYPKQITIDQIENGPVSLNLTSTTDAIVNVVLTKTAPAPAETPATPAPVEEPTSVVSPQQAEEIADTGEMTAGANPRAIMNFDDFVSESKKQWIKDVPMKKGALRKEMKKGKEEKITKEDIKKSEAKLKKKDKDKKKPGLQLNKKDAKTHKRNTLAMNLMKASGAISESRQDKIKGTKEALLKLHEVVEKMIKQTTAKNKGI